MSRVRIPSIAHFCGGSSHDMTFLQALILGIIQGATEFFPVSSSAHLRIFKYLLNIPDGEHLLYFDLLCHAGTLLALAIYLRKEIWNVLTHVHQIALFTLALLPLIPGYFLLKPVRIALSSPSFLGYFLILTSLLLFVAAKKAPSPEFDPLGRQSSSSSCFGITQKWKNVLWIGVMQTMALIPGISRSGATIAAARFCGWDWTAAARFSFLLAVPTILGGEFLETLKLVSNSSEATRAIPWTSYAVGFAAAFGVGLFAVRAVFWIYEKGKVRPFAWYCLGVGLLALTIFHG